MTNTQDPQPSIAALREFLEVNSINPEHLLRARGLEERLKGLSDLADNRYPGLEAGMAPENKPHLERHLHAALRELVAGAVSAHGVTVAPDAVVNAGGFSWVMRVSFNDRDCALIIPKFTSGDYMHRIKIRAEASRLVPVSASFEVPRVVRLFEDPVPMCLMTYATGENCYPRTFNAEGKPYDTAEGRRSGIEVFHKIGQMAAGYSQVRGERFGHLVEPAHETSAEYIRPFLEQVERDVMSGEPYDLSPYGITYQDLRGIIDWVKADIPSQSVSRMFHGDLSPWNLLYDRDNDAWTMTDGDDARYGIDGEQIGVCLNSMRGNFNREWIDAIAEGFGARAPAERRELLLRGAAYGTVLYGLVNAANPWDPKQAQMCRDVAFSFLAPCVRLFKELR